MSDRIDEPPDDDVIAEVIELRPGQDSEDDARHIVRERRKLTGCRHGKVRLDPDARRVYCRGCDLEIPAYDYIVTLAADWERYIANRREAERRMKVAHAHLSDLLRDERNAKSRRRSWQKLEPEAMRHLRALVGLCAQLAGCGHPTVSAAREFIDGEGEPTVEISA